jgi:hypothetical protein
MNIGVRHTMKREKKRNTFKGMDKRKETRDEDSGKEEQKNED